jgi:hypothetical protein
MTPIWADPPIRDTKGRTPCTHTLRSGNLNENDDGEWRALITTVFEVSGARLEPFLLATHEYPPPRDTSPQPSLVQCAFVVADVRQ